MGVGNVSRGRGDGAARPMFEYSCVEWRERLEMDVVMCTFFPGGGGDDGDKDGGVAVGGFVWRKVVVMWMCFCFLFAIGWLVGTFGVVVVVVRFGWLTPKVGGMG